MTGLTKAERKGLKEVRDHGWCARTDPIIVRLLKRKLMERDFSFHRKSKVNPCYKLTPKGKRTLGIR